MTCRPIYLNKDKRDDVKLYRYSIVSIPQFRGALKCNMKSVLVHECVKLQHRQRQREAPHL